MISFVEFKRHILEAFEGEPVKVAVSRVASDWFITASSLDDKEFALDRTNASEVADGAACRARALSVYKSLVEGAP